MIIISHQCPRIAESWLHEKTGLKMIYTYIGQTFSAVIARNYGDHHPCEQKNALMTDNYVTILKKYK